MHRHHRKLTLAILAVNLWGTTPLLAEIIPSGDTTVAATSSGTTTVGNTGIGTLAINGGSTLINSSSYLGLEGSSTGTATVSGAGSTWTNSGSLYVGRNGSGKLTVADGGLVTAQDFCASLDDLYGDGTITVTHGALLDADMVFDGSNSTTLAFGSGGTLNLTAQSGDLGAGYKGSGSMRVTNGAAVISTDGYLGRYAGSTGAATVTGTGSRWTRLCLKTVV